MYLGEKKQKTSHLLSTENLHRQKDWRLLHSTGALKLAQYFGLSWNAHVRSSACQPNLQCNTSSSMWPRSEPNLSASIQTKTNQPHLSVEKAVSHGLKGLHLEEEAARVGFFSNSRALERHSHLAAMKTQPRRSEEISQPNATSHARHMHPHIMESFQSFLASELNRFSPGLLDYSRKPKCVKALWV